MATKIALDTDVPQVCDFCGLEIETDMLIYGVGGSQYVRVYHAICPPKVWAAIEELRKAKHNDQTNQNSGTAV